MRLLIVLIILSASVAQLPENFIDNFGITKIENQPAFHDIYYEIKKCKEFTEEALKNIDEGTANFYLSTTAWSQFKGFDLVPERKKYYKNSQNGGERFYANLNFDESRYFSEEIKLQSCSIPSNEKGWIWNVQRLGPFESYGNYDWLQFGWHDAFNFKKVLEEYPDGILLDQTSMVPIRDDTGERIGHPPLHIHHIHVMQDPKGESVRPRTTFSKYNMSLIVEQHGDYQCLPKDGGISCLMERNPRGMGRLITGPIDLEGEINDVRAPRSEKLKWWLEVAYRWTPHNNNIQQISQEYIIGPGKVDYFDQSTYVATFPSPTNEETFYWYTGKMRTNGNLIRNKLHSHNSIFHSAYFLKGSPEQLGIGIAKFMPTRTYLPLSIKSLGFKNIDELKTYILSHINNHQTKIICQAFREEERVDGFLFDRRAPCHCDEWDFKQGDDFTVISFSKHNGDLVGPHLPIVPDMVPSHLHWVMQFIDLNRATSDFGTSIYTQTGYLGGSRDQPGALEILLQILWYGGLLQASTRNAANFYGTIFIVLLSLFVIYAISSILYIKVIKKYISTDSNNNVVYVQLTQKEC